MKLKFKLIVYFTILSIIILAVGGFSFSNSASNAIKSRVKAQLDSVITIKKNQIDHAINHNIEHIEYFSNDFWIKKAANYSYQNANNLIPETIIDPLNVQLTEYMKHAGFIELFVINCNGTVIASSDNKQIGKSKINEKYFQNGLNITNIQTFYYDISIQKIGSTVATPIFSEDYKIFGVLAGRINPDIISDILLERSGLGKSGETYLVNGINLFVSDSIYNGDFKYNKYVYTQAAIEGSEGIDGFGEYPNYLGDEVFGVYIWLPELNACLIGEIKTTEAFKEIEDLIATIISISFILISASLISIFIIANKISKPIEKLTDVTKKFRTIKNLSFDPPHTSHDEIGELTKSFHQMIVDLQESRKKIEDYNLNLEKKIQGRTNELVISKKELEKTVKNLQLNKKALTNMMNDLNETVNDLQKVKKEIELKNIDLEKAHHTLKELNNTLEKKVTERTEQIRELLQQKDEFINQLGHDLKNPLNPLVNLLPVIEKEEKDKEKRKILEVINRNVGYMKNLVTKTIELARLNSPYTEFNLENINLLNELNNVIDANKIMFNEKKIKVINNISKDLKVYVDKLRIEELFNNLLNNSVKYTPSSGNITIDSQKDDNFVTVSVKDTGIGMTQEHLDHVFDEFYKADSSRHDFDSSGLGMPICKRIVERHGGRIWAESEGLGKGSTFYFSLPKKDLILEKQNNKKDNDRDIAENKIISKNVDRILNNYVKK